MRGVEVGDSEAADQSFAPQRVEMFHRVEIGGMIKAPPVKLQQLDRLDAEPFPAALDAFADDRARHRPRRRAPFGEGDGRRVGARDRPAGDQLGAAVVIRHVERVEAAPRIGEQRRGRGFAVEFAAVALHVGDLPQADDDARDFEIGRERRAGRLLHRRAYLPSFALTALTSSVDISPVVVTLPSLIFHNRNGPVMSP